MTTSTDRNSVRRALSLLLRALLVAWACFWIWFVLAASSGESPAPPLWIPAAWIGGLTALAYVTWRWPIVGGIALIAAGVWSAFYFPNSGARSLLAAPAIVLGLGHLALHTSSRA